jgi:beta-aspartyl-peptidase (threonine type)
MAHRWLLLACLTLGCAQPARRPEPSIDPGRLTPSIDLALMRSAQAWNRGDLDGFMAVYAPDSLPTFVLRGHLLRGFDSIRRNYAPQFAPGAARDSLRFEEFNVRRISDVFALVTARYILFRNGRTTASGPFTLLLQHRPEGWKILHDHSSSD